MSRRFAAQLHTRARTCEDPREEGEVARKRQAKRRRQRLKQGLRTEHSLEKLRRLLARQNVHLQQPTRASQAESVRDSSEAARLHASQKLRLPRAALSSSHSCEPRGARRRAHTYRHLARNRSLEHRRKLENRVLLAWVSSGLPRHQLLCPGASRSVTTNRTGPAARHCRGSRRRRRRSRRSAGSLARRRSADSAHRACAAFLGGAAPNNAL